MGSRKTRRRIMTAMQRDSPVKGAFRRPLCELAVVDLVVTALERAFRHRKSGGKFRWCRARKECLVCLFYKKKILNF